MAKKDFTPEQIINRLKEAEILLNQGATIAVARGHTHTLLLVSVHLNSPNPSTPPTQLRCQPLKPEESRDNGGHVDVTKVGSAEQSLLVTAKP